MEGIRHRLLQSLSGRRFRTGTEIGAALGLTRASVHKHVQSLVDHGVPIHRVRGRGYRLAEGVVLLDGRAVAAGLSNRAGELLGGIEVFDEVDSTSAALVRLHPASLHCRVCLAEKQTAGRGRRGRSWIASPYRDLTMSVGVDYPQWPAHLPTLGLVTALMVVDALEQLNAPDLLIKWPNDVVHKDRKICGVLLDVTGEAHGGCRVVVGIGINVSASGMPDGVVDQPWVDLETITGGPLDRNFIAACCLNRLLPAFEAFPGNEFTTYRSEWRRRDALRDRWIQVHGADGAVFSGQATGVDEAGRLAMLGADGAAHLFTQGDVSVRFQ